MEICGSRLVAQRHGLTVVWNWIRVCAGLAIFMKNGDKIVPFKTKIITQSPPKDNGKMDRI